MLNRETQRLGSRTASIPDGECAVRLAKRTAMRAAGEAERA